MVTSVLTIDYKTFEKFQNFALKHGEIHALDTHLERGLPSENFSEAYLRFSKTLVRVGRGGGSDQRTGMGFELTALDNPYDGGDSIRYLLTRKDVPKDGHQVEVHNLAPGDEDATLQIFSTDENGVVTIPVLPGKTLVNSVALEIPPSGLAEAYDVVWYSLWASSTFWIE